ncbi:MAG TPA: hypothetical protein G4O01_09080 [Dehalococcoidia bacterium]|jgi:hypothetical protein|nr:hypothetical protein [Dehalococcoidia bacterium]
MSRKMKLLSLVLVAMLLISVGGATVALAQEDEEAEPQEEQIETEVVEEAMPTMAPGVLFGRVAEILGVSEEELKEAFIQARQEMMEERWEEAFYRLLDKAVEEGLLTQEEADEIKDWWEQRPEALNLEMLKRTFGFIAPHLKNRPNGGGRKHSELGPPWLGEMERPGMPPWVGKQRQQGGPPPWVGQMQLPGLAR